MLSLTFKNEDPCEKQPIQGQNQVVCIKEFGSEETSIQE